MNTYPINLTKIASEQYSLGLSNATQRLILIQDFMISQVKIKMFYHCLQKDLINSFQNLVVLYLLDSIHATNKEIIAWETRGSRLVLSPTYRNHGP